MTKRQYAFQNGIRAIVSTAVVETLVCLRNEDEAVVGALSLAGLPSLYFAVVSIFAVFLAVEASDHGVEHLIEHWSYLRYCLGDVFVEGRWLVEARDAETNSLLNVSRMTIDFRGFGLHISGDAYIGYLGGLSDGWFDTDGACVLVGRRLPCRIRMHGSRSAIARNGAIECAYEYVFESGCRYPTRFTGLFRDIYGSKTFTLKGSRIDDRVSSQLIDISKDSSGSIRQTL